MIYVDSSILLADLFVGPRSPPETLWIEDLVSSQLLGYEVWNRINVHGLMVSHGGRARGLLARVNLTEISEPALTRALEPFPVAIRALDALHLSTGECLRGQGGSVAPASYNNRLVAAARALGIKSVAPEALEPIEKDWAKG